MADKKPSQAKALSFISLGVVGAVFVGLFTQNEKGVPMAQAIVAKFKDAKNSIQTLVPEIAPNLEMPSADKEQASEQKPADNSTDTQLANKPENPDAPEKSDSEKQTIAADKAPEQDKIAQKDDSTATDGLNSVVEKMTSGAQELAKQLLDKVDETMALATDDAKVSAPENTENQAAEQKQTTENTEKSENQEMASLDVKDASKNKPAIIDKPIATQNESSKVSPQSTPEALPEKPNDGTPTIDLLRVEPNGSVVIAGQSEPDTAINIFDGGALVAKGRSNKTGDYVIIFDEPLKKGDHELIVKSGDDPKTQITSAVSGVIVLPENKEEMIVLLSTPGEASKILQMPTSRFDTSTRSEEHQNTKITKLEETPTAKPELETIVSSTPILVNAVDVEANAYYIAGAAKPGSTVYIYLDNEFKGRAITGIEGAFLFYAKAQILPGRYALRVDMLDDEGVNVVSRAQVMLEHEIEKVQIASLDDKVAKSAIKNEMQEIAQEKAASAKSAAPSKPAADDPNAQIMVAKNGVAKIGEAELVEKAMQESDLPESDKPKTDIPATDLKVAKAPASSNAATPKDEQLAIQSQGQARSNPSNTMNADPKNENMKSASETTGENADVQSVAQSAAKTDDETKNDNKIANKDGAMSKPVSDDPNAQIMVSKNGVAKIGEAGPIEPSDKMAKEPNKNAPNEKAPMQILKEKMAEQQAANKDGDPEQVAIKSTGEKRSNPSDLMQGNNKKPDVKVITSGSSVIIRRGDNLWRISRRILGEGRKYTVIYEANQSQIQDPDRIYPGQVFDVPKGEEKKTQ